MTRPATVGLLHPGAMGAALGRVLVDGGATVRWAPEGRSAATAARAGSAGLIDAGTLAGVVGASDVVVSVCPPGNAVEVARSVADRGFAGLYLDANAVAPATAREIAEVVAPAAFVDGGIIGPPPHGPGSTRLYLSGDAAPTVADLFAGGPLDAHAIAGGAGAASAVKACFAAWTKGGAALLLAIRGLAASEGVEGALLGEWALSQPDLAARAELAAAGTAPKAWRFVGEMDEAAAAFAAAGLPDGFSLAAAEVFRRLDRYRDADPPPPLADVVDALLPP